LEGVQGSGKSSAIQILAGDDFYSDATLLDKSTQEQQELLAGVWIFEIADLVGMRRAGIEEIKAFASRTHDRARPAYGHFREDQPRRCILIATTNNDTYLNDPTGNRRFWPIKTAKIDLALLAGDRDQLWAEAAHIEAQGESLNLPAELWNAAAEATDLRRAQDPWEGSLSSLRSNTDCGDERVSTSDILSQLDIPPGLQSVAHAQRLGPIMRSLGWNGPKTIRINGKAQKGYQRSLEGAHGNAPF
jgi:predicted P-loop ATPase